MVTVRPSLSRNIVALWSALVIRLAVGLVFVPYIAASLGPSRYGVWTVLFQIINYLALLDFGFEKAVVTFVASFWGKGDHDGINRTLATSSRLYLWFGLAAFAGACLSAWLLLPHLRAESTEVLREGQMALVIIGLFTALRFWFTPVTAALGGFQRYDVVTSAQVVEDVVRTIVMIVLLGQGYGLVALALAVLGFGFVRMGISIWLLKCTFPQWRLTVSKDPALAKDLFSYSRITFGITIAWLIIFNTDSIILGFMASTVAAGVFAPAAQLALYSRHLINAIGTPLTAAAAHAGGAADLNQSRERYLKLFGVASYAGFAMMAGVALYAEPFVKLWLPAGFEETARAMIILAAGSAAFLPHILSNAMLFALNRHRYLLITVAIEAGLKLVLAIALVGKYQVTGIALANAIPQVVIYIAVYPVLAGRAIGISPSLLIGRQFRTAVLAIVFTLLPGKLIGLAWSADNWVTLVASMVGAAVISAAGFWISMSPDERAEIRSRLLRRY
ncbi:MAG: oligosaccharide flippase family protein [candidate division Zixibacteria bacterium]|nr:oligosaccharide flippase family protein [candidate division Zixibacteria bacterium]